MQSLVIAKVVPSSLILSTLIMETSPSETSVPTKARRRHSSYPLLVYDRKGAVSQLFSYSSLSYTGQRLILIRNSFKINSELRTTNHICRERKLLLLSYELSRSGMKWWKSWNCTRLIRCQYINYMFLYNSKHKTQKSIFSISLERRAGRSSNCVPGPTNLQWNKRRKHPKHKCCETCHSNRIKQRRLVEE
jgi:hypothetical protein